MASGTLTDLLLLGRESDPLSERGVSCDGQLPAASDPRLVERAQIARAALGSRAMILGHHYQRDEVIDFADITGDSFKLAQAAAQSPDAELIIKAADAYLEASFWRGIKREQIKFKAALEAEGVKV